MSFMDDLHRTFSRVRLTDYQILKAAEKWYGSKRDVAAELGVSTRHVQRMMKQARTSGGRMRISGELRQRIRAMYQTPEVRSTMAAPRRARALTTAGAHMTMRGELGPIVYDPVTGVLRGDYTRPRAIQWPISAAGMSQIRDAWETGDPEYTREVTREVIEAEYGVSGWDWHDDGGFELDFR